MLRKLEKYEILEEIGHGGMATVYKARDTRLDRLVAVKVLHPHLRTAEEARTRFTREAKSVAKLRHTNILEIYDYSGDESEESYIAAELLTGPTLRAFVDKGAEVPAEVAACFVIEIARALTAAHEKGIVHRDVKPENVLIHEARCIKLTDFGIAQMVDAQGFTATGQILGSPGHMAPEQIEGGEIDVRTDLFSLGTVLYYLAVSRLPFVGRNPHQVLKRIMDGDFPDPLRVRPTIGGELKAIIDKSLTHEPGGRYQDAAEFEVALTDFVMRAGEEDPTALLAEFLGDPVATTARLEAQVVPRLIERGTEASSAGDVGTALDCFNRALALDEGNELALRRIEQMGQRGRRRRMLSIGLALVFGFSGLGAIGYAIGGPQDPPVPAVILPEGLDAGVDSDTDAESLALSQPDAALEDAALAVADAAPDAQAHQVVQKAAVLRPPRGPRRVNFAVRPRNVSISINGAPLQEFGPGHLQHMELPTGRTHTARVVTDSPCCDERTFRFTVPRGTEPYTQHLRLEPRDAALRVTTRGISARVEVLAGRGGSASGATNGFVDVPMGGLGEEQRQIRVTAPGYTEYTGTVRLQAGQSASVRAILRPVEAPEE